MAGGPQLSSTLLDTPLCTPMMSATTRCDNVHLGQSFYEEHERMSRGVEEPSVHSVHSLNEVHEVKSVNKV
jgi:hypothetical protein